MNSVLKSSLSSSKFNRLCWRAKVYYYAIEEGKAPPLATPIKSGAMKRDDAEGLLEKLLSMPGVSEGQLERHIQGLGWCLADDTNKVIEQRFINDDWICD